MISPDAMGKLQRALPFWLSLLLVPLIAFVAWKGGWWLLLVPLATWWLFGILDHFTGLELENADLATSEDQLFWYRLVTLIWAPLQFAVIYGVIFYATRADHLKHFLESLRLVWLSSRSNRR